MRNREAVFTLLLMTCGALSACGERRDAKPDSEAASKPEEKPAPEPETRVDRPVEPQAPIEPPAPIEAQTATPPDAGPPRTAAPPADVASAPAAAGDVELVETDGLMLESLVLAQGVEKRQPVNPGSSFSVAQSARIYAIMTVQNPAQQEAELSVAWAPADGGQERGTVTVTVGPQKKWRTWAFTRTLSRPGPWTAIVRTADGAIIGKAHFEMTP